MKTNTPKISVVIASHNARASIKECLSAVISQSQGGDLEIVVVDNSTDGTTEVIRRQFPDIKLHVEPESALIPELWRVGILESTGEIVAITTAHFVAHKEWLPQILKAHRASVAAVGGAIENDDSAGVVDWAVYFCRYAPYMLPFQKGFVSEIAGDNASYKREYLNRYQHVWRDGFWEPAVHAELKKAGFRLLLAPSIILRHKRSFSFWAFIKQRFYHGMRFGEGRCSRLSLSKRTLYVLLSPAIPLLFLARITREVLAKQRYLGKFLVALPILLVFLLAWSFGELLGYLRGPGFPPETDVERDGSLSRTADDILKNGGPMV